MASDALSVLDGVQARIRQIESLTLRLSQGLGTPGPTSIGPASPGLNSFASVLDAVQGAGTSGPTSTPAGAVFAAADTPTVVPASASTAGSSTGSEVVAQASKYLGVPYQWGGTDPSTGLDCSGLVQLTFGQLGIQLPRTSQEQQQVGSPVASVTQAQPGDLVFYGSPAEHVGIYIGNGQMIDAPHTGTNVRVDSVGVPTSIRRVTGYSPRATTFSSAPTAGVQPTGTALGSVPPALAPLFLASAARYGLSPKLLAAVAKVESDFDPNAVSPAGAEGLMQIMPSTAASLGVDPFDPAQAVDGAARLLAQNLAQFGSLPLAVAAYNAGGGAVQTYGGIPPYPETENYVQKVMSLSDGAAA
ncbi:MAG TPA: NlpC/P60 family protein [Acidimicrobiales bacterium]|nr:NlpC/P60 family protein [Acidimicrobiales bacterium]